MKNVKPIYLLCFCGISLILILQFALYRQSVHTVELEGTINTVDNVQVVSFNPFEPSSPVQLNLPSSYDFDDRARVDCELKVYEVFGIRYYNLISIGKADKMLNKIGFFADFDYIDITDEKFSSNFILLKRELA